MAATKTSRGDNVARDLESLGATIVNKDNSLGYVSALVPIQNVKAAAALTDVEVVDLDELIELEPRLSDDPDASPPGPTTPPQNAYMPTRDTGAPQFVAANPTYDGRGTVIGILDTGVDLFHPALQTTTTGARKVIDWVTATSPIVDGSADKSWIPMSQQVNVVGGTFTVGADTYTGAADGEYLFGVFDEAALGVAGPTEYDIACGADVNRNGVCGEKFAVLWRTSDDTVWVDANADKSFSGELAMHEYKQTFDIGTFGVENPATPLRDTVPFTIQTDGKNKFVSIGIVSGAHGTHVSGIAAGHGFFNGAFDGAAPGAQIVMVRVCLFINSCTARALIDGMVYAAKHANVDVINMSIGGLPALNDGNNARALLYNRLIEQSNVQMFISAGNSGPGINTVGDPSVASLVMSVGAYVHKDTWNNNYGANAAKDDGMFVFSSRGPREDGGFKPDIVAPGSAVSSIPEWERNAPLVRPLPAGYDMFNGTSMAAPQAAGAAALLLSAAKQAGAQHQPAQLRQAIKSSARFLPYYQAIDQGNGLFDVGAAWNLLKTNIKTSEITSSVPVSTRLSGFLATPNVGIGIHDREGVLAGGPTYTRDYTITRTKGGSSPVGYNLSWVGNDGTFSSPATLSLGANTPTTLTVTINPAVAGAHSAILNIDDPNTVGIDYQTMNTVIAALPLNSGNNFKQIVTGSADRPDTNKPRQFFAVPSGTTMIRVTATTLTGRLRLMRQHPFGFSIDGTAGYCSAGVACQSGQPAGTVQRVFTPTAARPTTGVWEVTMDTSRTSGATPSTYSVTFETFSVTISPTSWTETGVAIPTTKGPFTFTATNNGASFTGRISGGALASAYEQTPNTFNPGGAQQVRFIDLPAGTTRLTVQIFQLPGAAADLDLFVYDCTAGPSACVLRGQGIGSTANETVEIATGLNAGQWKAVVDPFFVPAGGTNYRYIDEYAKSGLGNIATTDVAAVRTTGSTWTADATATLTASPGVGRFFRGAVNVAAGSTILASAEARFIP
jgi:subtilisin family serine protease